jgi:hypothetical protein
MNPMTGTRTIPVRSIGLRAWQELQAGGEARVIGITSGGVFLLTERQWALFITAAPFRGPLTANLSPVLFNLVRAERGMPVLLEKGGFHFLVTGLHLAVRKEDVWQPPAPPNVGEINEECLLRINSFARRVAELKSGEKGFAPLLPLLVGERLAAPEGELALVWGVVVELEQALKLRGAEAVEKQLGRLTGRGIGLTPSGDDLATGLLLALNRWPKLVCPGLKRGKLNKAIIARARRETTSLAASMIENAAEGWADERILVALDGMLAGGVDLESSAIQVAALGHSTGADTLLGMVVALRG